MSNLLKSFSINIMWFRGFGVCKFEKKTGKSNNKIKIARKKRKKDQNHEEGVYTIKRIDMHDNYKCRLFSFIHIISWFILISSLWQKLFEPDFIEIFSKVHFYQIWSIFYHNSIQIIIFSGLPKVEAFGWSGSFLLFRLRL